MADFQYLTYRFRVKDSSSRKHLEQMAIAVNQVWNYCGDIQNDSKRLNRRWPTFPELARLTAGCTKDLGLHSDTVQDVLKHWVKSRDKAYRRPRWRSSFGAKRSLGWIPFQCTRPLRISGDDVTFLGKRYRLWLSRDVPPDIRSGSFSQDTEGRWFLNLICKVACTQSCGSGEVGIDLGIKDLATLSTGEVVENPRHLRRSSEKLAKAQRANRKSRARAVYRKIVNQRRHYLHTVSTRLIKENALIVVGDVSSSKMAKTRMAKSVLDAGWYSFKSMLHYKAIGRGAVFTEVNERYSTQTCSSCGGRHGPKGIAGLSVRSWVCQCGSSHDRDVNAALNILLASGRNVGLLTETAAR